MAQESRPARQEVDEATIPAIEPAGGTASIEAATPGRRSSVRRLLDILGPGLITGASDDDPSGIGTYAIAGASTGFAMLWMALFTFPMMSSVQFMCAKIGMVSGRGLAGVLRTYYTKPLLYLSVFGLVVANTINAGADIGAIAAGFNLLVKWPVWIFIIAVSIIILGIQIWGSYRLMPTYLSG